MALPDGAQPLDYDLLLESIAGKRFVLLGEASHGTHEFYRERAEITKRLVAEQGFTAVAAEADWPDAHRVNRYLRGAGGDANPDEALADFPAVPGLDVAQHRGRRLPRLAASLERRAAAEPAQGRLLRARPLQPPHLDGGGRLLPRADRS